MYFYRSALPRPLHLRRFSTVGLRPSMSAPLSTVLQRNTNALFAHASRNSERSIVPINDCALETATPRPAFYCVHSASGVAGTDSLDLARFLEPSFPFFVTHAPPTP